MKYIEASDGGIVGVFTITRVIICVPIMRDLFNPFQYFFYLQFVYDYMILIDVGKALRTSED